MKGIPRMTLPTLEKALIPEWKKFVLKLQGWRFLVAGIVYLFTLAVGLVTLYVNSPTFGANAADYVTLFLWGVASNAVGGQSIDLKSIWQQTQEG